MNSDPQIILNLPLIGLGDQKIKVSMIIQSDIISEGQIFWARDNGFVEENSVKFNYGVGDTYYERTLDYSGINQLRIDISNTPGRFTISEFKIEVVDNKSLADIDYLNENSFIVTEYSNDHISGSVIVDKPKKLFLSIPYDKGWRAKVNGENTKITRVNIGFIGIDLTAGNNIVELNYMPPLFVTGIIISTVLLLGIIIYIVVVKRFRLTKIKN
ncbi:Bacterial membrane protein YfhO [compost metagenome]